MSDRKFSSFEDRQQHFKLVLISMIPMAVLFIQCKEFALITDVSKPVAKTGCDTYRAEATNLGWAVCDSLMRLWEMQ